MRGVNCVNNRSGELAFWKLETAWPGMAAGNLYGYQSREDEQRRLRESPRHWKTYISAPSIAYLLDQGSRFG